MQIQIAETDIGQIWREKGSQLTWPISTQGAKGRVLTLAKLTS